MGENAQQSIFKDYIEITKPGIITSNLLGTIAGFCIGARNLSSSLSLWELFFWTVLGTVFVIGSSAIVNNVYDADIDKHMERTKNRPITNGRIPKRNAILLSVAMIVIGELILGLFVNPIAALIGFIGFVFYGFVYTMSKRVTVVNTEIGCISGATPPIIGYTAVTGNFDLIALLLFVFMFAWQPPHFFALAMKRAEEYKSVNVPMLPNKVGFKQTKVHILIYTVFAVAASLLLYFFNVLGLWYLIVAGILGAVFLFRAIQSFKFKEKESELVWSGKMFKFSIMYLTLMFVTMMFAPIFG
ncbi:heme o synthase [Fictibacillus fluitans]|uniref:Protoheme IX farnesyltransferase n=1 Tax=Fictibacillus fluitans TaxID=3058422 RepID=A0ABT8HUF9_9BACL|nr:heme o synthase [Fictibacillus sp. NE201]MDN4524415.1 heme o synthase [Fictibacillus sp. NE201]